MTNITYEQTEMQRQQLLELLKASLWKHPIDLEFFTACQWEDVFNIAQEQAVLGIAVDGKTMLPKALQPNLKTGLKWVKTLMKIEETNQLMNKAVEAVVRGYQKLDIHPLVMKGQIIAKAYPKPTYRQSGDIDLCFKSQEDADKAYKWTQKKFNLRWMPGEKETSFVWKGFTIELHRRIADMQYAPFQKHLQTIVNTELSNTSSFTTEIAGKQIPTFSPTLTLLHLIIHLQYHLLNEGVGLRQFCDLAVYTTSQPTANYSQLQQWLRDCGLERITAAIAEVIHQLFDIDRELILWQPHPEHMSQHEIEAAAQMIINDIWTGGNFGEKKWDFKNHTNFVIQKVRALPLHWKQYRKYRSLLPHEAWANFKSKFKRAAKGIK